MPSSRSSSVVVPVLGLLMAAQCICLSEAFLAQRRAFRIGRPVRENQIFPSYLQRRMSTDNAVEEADAIEEGDEKASLVFLVELNHSSDPLPPGTTAEQVKEFMENQETPKLMLSAGGIRDVEEISLSTSSEFDLDKLWKEMCEEEYGDVALPEAGDCILATDTVTKLPGLELHSTIYNGVKTSTNAAGKFPMYSFYLVGQEQSARGPKPVVWIFNKLTGTDSKKKDKASLKPSAIAKSDITVLEDASGNLVFNYDSMVKITVKFPAALMKILPTTKEKAEASATSSIGKGVRKDVEKGAKGVYDAFIEFQKQQQQQLQ